MSYIPKEMAENRMSVQHIHEQFVWLLEHNAPAESFYELSGVIEYYRKRSEFLTRSEFDYGWQNHQVSNQNGLDFAASEFIKVITGM